MADRREEETRNKDGRLIESLPSLMPINVLGGTAKNIKDKGFAHTAGQLYRGNITGATNLMEGIAGAGREFKAGARINNAPNEQQTITQGNINQQFTEGEAQFNRLDDAQIAPMTTGGIGLEGQDITPGNIIPAETRQLEQGPIPDFQPEAGFKGIEGIGGETIYRNTNVDPKKYGQAIYSDTVQGALPAGFDKDIREQGIGVTDPETGITNTPFSRTAQPEGAGAQPDPARQAYDKANQLMSQMPYGSPGDRQKRQNLVAQARTLVGIAGGLQRQTEAGRQYGLDVFDSTNPARVSQIGRFKDVAAVPAYVDDHGNVIPAQPAYRFDSSTGIDVESPQQSQARFATPTELWEAHKAGEIGQKEANNYLKKYFPELAIEE